jgi:hypothetical protein
LFTGHYPRGIFSFVEGVFRWHNRVIAYALILVTDRYPPFRLDPWLAPRAARRSSGAGVHLADLDRQRCDTWQSRKRGGDRLIGVFPGDEDDDGHTDPSDGRQPERKYRQLTRGGTAGGHGNGEALLPSTFNL